MEKAITGMMVYYFHVCKRKLWYFYQNITMEQENENVLIGKILDEESYSREEKHININDVINIDYIKSKKILHEIKKSRKIEEASIWQVKYYLYYLKQRGVTEIKGQIDYPLLKQSIMIELNNNDEAYLKEMLIAIEEIVNLSNLEPLVKQTICKSCAYFDLCYI